MVGKERHSFATDLYVMQTEHGLVKIGNAVEHDDQRKKYERFHSCRIALLLVCPGRDTRLSFAPAQTRADTAQAPARS